MFPYHSEKEFCHGRVFACRLRAPSSKMEWKILYHCEEGEVKELCVLEVSMIHLVEFPLEGGGSIFVQIDESETDGVVCVGRVATIEKARETLEDALNKVLPSTLSIIEKLQSMRTTEFEVTFGITLSLQAGAFITASSNAKFGVKVH
jgi:Trypsin-co-occurring domain 1